MKKYISVVFGVCCLVMGSGAALAGTSGTQKPPVIDIDWGTSGTQKPPGVYA
jgi:hypothetical protein